VVSVVGQICRELKGFFLSIELLRSYCNHTSGRFEDFVRSSSAAFICALSPGPLPLGGDLHAFHCCENTSCPLVMNFSRIEQNRKKSYTSLGANCLSLSWRILIRGPFLTISDGVSWMASIKIFLAGPHALNTLVTNYTGVNLPTPPKQSVVLVVA
jgi:hypothetical protein